MGGKTYKERAQNHHNGTGILVSVSRYGSFVSDVPAFLLVDSSHVHIA